MKDEAASTKQSNYIPALHEKMRQSLAARPPAVVVPPDAEPLLELLSALEDAIYDLALGGYTGSAKESLAIAEKLLDGALKEWTDREANEVRRLISWAWPANAPNSNVRVPHMAQTIWSARQLVRSCVIPFWGANVNRPSRTLPATSQVGGTRAPGVSLTDAAETRASARKCRATTNATRKGQIQ